MKFIELNISKNESETKLLPLLNGKVFHFTTLENARKIYECGWIKGDKNLKQTFTHFSSRSYGRKRGYICLCDLRNWDLINEKDQDLIMGKLPFLYPRKIETPCYFIINSKLHESLIGWKTANDEFSGFERDLYVHDLECWSKDDISTQDCDLLIRVNFKS